MTKNLTPKRYEKTLADARARHDARYEIDNPPPVAAAVDQDTRGGLERWLMPALWGVIAVAAAVVSLPHTLKVLLNTVPDLPGWAALAFSIAAFITVEGALILLAYISEREGAGISVVRKQWSVAGLINAAALRVGVKPPIDTDHLPDQQESGGRGLVLALLGAAVVFNLADTLAPVLPAHAENIRLLSKLVAGLLGPVALFLAGHYTARALVAATHHQDQAAAEHRRALAQWEQRKNQSWAAAGDGLIAALLAERGYVDHGATDQEEHAGPFAVPAAMPATNGRH